MKRFSRKGVLTALFLLAIGATAAGIAWWNNLAHTQRALTFWGPEAALLIRDAPHVSAARVRVPRPGERGEVLESHDISRAKGLVHLRHALLDNRSYAWGKDVGPVQGPAYAIRFVADRAEVTIYLSDDLKRLEVPGAEEEAGSPANSRRTLSTEPIAEGLQQYLAEVFSAPRD